MTTDAEGGGARPTPERLEQLLAEYPHRPPQGGCCDKHLTPRLDAHELADEVRALRAVIGRVAALPNIWLDDIAYRREGDCAKDVVQALKDPP